MPKHSWSLLCRRALVDKHSNTLSLIEVIDEVMMQESPPESISSDDVGIAIDGFLVSVWTRSEPEEPETLFEVVTVTGPNGETHGDAITIEGNLRDHNRVRLLMGIRAIRYYGPGTYTFNIHCSKEEGGPVELIGRVPLVVKATETAASSAPEQPSEQS